MFIFKYAVNFSIVESKEIILGRLFIKRWISFFFSLNYYNNKKLLEEEKTFVFRDTNLYTYSN